ncbi:hypothetical protein [Halorubrum sp. Hd13]|uniref:hypothetical protein n=1 Tax=Halorubrum sp. Hd13 TaxID=1480728 RepID=UPI000B98CE04|nr:hypothetical protein [Halorubrum sp. Hd13]OYR38550.1 hypothetical protein DJ81_17720 [Halorubrum sp. Hd13]
MDDSRPRGGDPFAGPTASVDDAQLRRIGAVLWALAFCSVTAVILFSEGRLAGLGWRDATLIAVRTFAGVFGLLRRVPAHFSGAVGAQATLRECAVDATESATSPVPGRSLSGQCGRERRR